MATVIAWSGVVFAGLAAVFWAWSSLVNLPVLSSVIRDIDNLGPFYRAMKRVARLNSVAAACAFVSALAQALVFMGH